MILELEEVALNAWPALRTLVYDGWLLRMSDGYTRRANAVHPFYASTLPLDEKIDTCERLYAACGLPTIFKLTNAAQPSELDAALEARGYRQDAGACIMTLALGSVPSLNPAAHIETTVSGGWIGHYTRLNAERAKYNHILPRLFGAIPAPAAYLTLARDEQVVGVGMAVAERGYVGLFGLAIDPAFRRRGLGRQLVQTCLTWGAAQGARRAYLQVHPRNMAAISLYEGVGFRDTYRYWYRQQPV